jgi:ribosomal RNA-processing protein 9
MHRVPNTKRRKVSEVKVVKTGGRTENKMQWQDEEISSEEEQEDMEAAGSGDESGEDADESAESKRLRLAKQYLSHMSAHDGNDSDESGDDNVDASAAVSDKLKASRLRAKGELYENLLPAFSNVDIESCTRRDLNGHQASVTCVALTKDEETVFSGSKDNSVLKWDVETGENFELRPRWNKNMDYQSCKGEVLSVAVSHDGRYVASAGKDCSVRIYDSRQKYAEIKELKGHRDTVTSLSFRMDTYTLFSGSLDRCLKHWDVNDLAYIETMFGHQVCAPPLR